MFPFGILGAQPDGPGLLSSGEPDLGGLLSRIGLTAPAGADAPPKDWSAYAHDPAAPDPEVTVMGADGSPYSGKWTRAKALAAHKAGLEEFPEPSEIFPAQAKAGAQPSAGGPAAPMDQAGGAVQTLPPPRPIEFGGGSDRGPATTGSTAPAIPEKNWADKFGDSGGWDMLIGLGAGIASGKNWSDGIGKGLEGAQRGSLIAATTAEKRTKLQQAQAGQNMTLNWLVGKGVPVADAQAAVAASAAGRPELLQTHFNNLLPKAESGYRIDPANPGGVVPVAGGQNDPAVIAARAKAQAEGTAAGQPDRDSWVQADVPDGKGNTVRKWVKKGESDGVTIGSPNAPDTVDPTRLAEERAKEQAKLEAGALKKGEVSQTMSPVLQRAHDAYEKLVAADGVGPAVGSDIGRRVGATFHSKNEALRQEYEAAAKDLELFQAQTKMKGQGAITEGERKLLALTLPRLDAVDGATGIRTLRAMREELGRSLQAAQGSPLASSASGIRQEPVAGQVDPMQQQRRDSLRKRYNLE